MRYSIIIPVHNNEKYLRKCLDSVIGQTDRDWECWIIDDGSTDRSGSICDSYAKKDKRFKVVHTPNKGVSHARNTGIEKSSGEWITFLDSDDWMEKNKLRVCYEAAVKNNVKMLWHATNVYQANIKKSVWHNSFPGIFKTSDNKVLSSTKYDIGACWNKLYHGEEIRSDKTLRFGDCDIAEDLIFNIRVYYKFGELLSIPQALYNYNLRRGTLSSTALNGERKLRFILGCETMFNDLWENDAFRKNFATTRAFLDGVYRRRNRSNTTIDYVFPYVDFNDKNWKNNYNKHVSKDKKREVNGVERYRYSEELLKYKFRCIAKWMPWVGNVHLVVSSESQVPKWIDWKKVHVVLHKDIIPAKFLPTFNSSTIMMYCQNIFGLAERYILSNDDIFPNAYLQPSHFFNNDKLCIKSFTKENYNATDNAPLWMKIFHNSYALARKVTKRPQLPNKKFWNIQHVGKPMFRSFCVEMYDKYRNEIEDSMTMFRDSKNLNEYFYCWMAKFSGKTLEKAITNNVYDVSEERLKNIDNIVSAPAGRVQSLCINDDERVSIDVYKKLEDIFKKKYPDKCKYEKGYEANKGAVKTAPVKKYERIPKETNPKMLMPKAVRHFYGI